MAKPRCRNCDNPHIDRRGLCQQCYRTPAIRAHYGQLKELITGLSPTDTPTRLPAEPCPERPGSEARIRTLEKRVENGERLFHPEDATTETYDRS